MDSGDDFNMPGEPAMPINNMERVKVLFDRIRLVGQLSNEAKILVEYVFCFIVILSFTHIHERLIPSVVVDLFPSVDQILSFILNEFLKQAKSNPTIMAAIMFKVCTLRYVI